VGGRDRRAEQHLAQLTAHGFERERVSGPPTGPLAELDPVSRIFEQAAQSGGECGEVVARDDDYA